MASLATALGLRANASLAVSNQAPYYAIFNYVLAYIVLAPRHLRQRYGIDHNESPRQDTAKFGERAVQEGKLTQTQLDKLKRMEAAHANSMENFTVFVASVLFATVSNVKREKINGACLVYSLARLGYGIAYIQIATFKYSLIRTLMWKIGVISNIYLFWQSAKALNG